MANLRIVLDNAADRTTAFVATTTAGSLVAANMLTDIKSEVWRGTGTTGQFGLTWANGAEIVGVVTLPFCNLTSSATIRVRCYTNIGDSVPALDTGAQPACPSGFGSYYWGMTQLGVNAYAYGGSSCATIWFAPTSCKYMLVDIADSTNPAGYVEVGKLVTGSYWEASNNCPYGASVTPNDMSKNERSDAGDLRTDRGPRFKSLSFDLQYMTATDRNMLWRILMGSGLRKPLFVSLSPGAVDVIEEQLFQIYGKLSKMSTIKYQFLDQFDSSLDIEEI